MYKKILAGAVCGAALLASTSASAADKTVNRYLDLLNSASSYNYTMSMPMKFVMPKVEKGAKPFQMDYNVKISGAVVDQNKVGKEKQDLHVVYELKSPEFKQMFFSDKIAFTPDIKTSGNDLYIKLNETPGILAAIVDLSDIEKQWVKISQSDIEKLLNQMVANGTEQDKAEMKKAVSEMKLSVDPTKQLELRKKYLDILKKNNFMTAGKKLANGKAANLQAEKWQIKLNKDEVSKLFIALLEMSSDGKATKEDKTQMATDLKGVMKNLSFSTGELAIAKNGKATDLKISGKLSDLDGDKTTNDSLSFALNMTTKDMGSKTIKIDMPTKFMTLDEAIKAAKVNPSFLESMNAQQ